MHFIHTYSPIVLIKILVYLLIVTCDAKVSVKSVDLKQTKIWGLGLEPHKVVLPVRYFYIQARDVYGYPFNATIPTKFEVNIFGDSETGKCRVRIDQLDRRDGTYIVRYKIIGRCWNVEIHVTYKQQHVADSPYRITGDVYSEKCNCPKEIDQWLADNQCDSSYEQIDADLKPFKSVNFTDIRSKILQKFDHPGGISLCNVVIKNNQLFRKCHGQHTGFKMFIDALFKALVKLVKLPDVEFMMNLGDWPLMKKGGITRTHGPFPIFSWCGSEDTFDIVVPTYDLTEATIEAMNRVTIDILSVQNAKTAWIEKKAMAFWRGRDSRRERLRLIEIARDHPHLINASLTNFFFYRDEEDKYGPKVPHISLFDFFEYKYQLNIDGTVAAYRLPYLLASNAMVIKQESPFYEYFYKQLKPMQHYVPVKRDLSNLVDQIRWANRNDDAARKISQQAQEFVNANLTPDKVLCYHVTLLKEWSKRLTGNIEVQSDMENVPDERNECDCGNTAIRDEL